MVETALAGEGDARVDASTNSLVLSGEPRAIAVALKLLAVQDRARQRRPRRGVERATLRAASVRLPGGLGPPVGGSAPRPSVGQPARRRRSRTTEGAPVLGSGAARAASGAVRVSGTRGVRHHARAAGRGDRAHRQWPRRPLRDARRGGSHDGHHRDAVGSARAAPRARRRARSAGSRSLRRLEPGCRSRRDSRPREPGWCSRPGTPWWSGASSPERSTTPRRRPGGHAPAGRSAASAPGAARVAASGIGSPTRRSRGAPGSATGILRASTAGTEEKHAPDDRHGRRSARSPLVLGPRGVADGWLPPQEARRW